VKIDDLSLEQEPLGGAASYYGYGGPPRILFVSSAPVDVSSLSFLSQNYGQVAIASRAADVVLFDERTRDQLPRYWINYSGLDLVFLSLADARELAANRPDVWQAINEWTRSGGNLCVFDAGSDWGGLEELERLTNTPAGAAAGQKYRGWEAPSKSVFETQVVPEAASYDAQSANPQQIVVGGVVVTAPAPANAPSNTPALPGMTKAPKEPPFVWRKARFGTVVAIAAAQPFPGDNLVWRWLLASLGPSRTDWGMRHGTVPDQPNPQFNDFLIADVGLPPIPAYRVLITVFVVAIGPLNYWLLRRKGRLHLFLFTVPLAALVTSGALFAWALIDDGLESRLRARSLTYLDQETGEAVRHARLSYYTGLAPSTGLRFSGQTAIVPLELAPYSGVRRSRSREMEWAGEQFLTRRWLGSRTPMQYVTVRADNTKQKLARVPNVAGVTVENRLGVAIHELVWCELDGRLYHGHTIAPQATASLRLTTGAADAEELVRRAGRAVSQHGPGYPGTISAFDTRASWLFPTSARRFFMNQGGGADTTRSQLEVELAEIRSAIMAQALEPGTYVAVVDRPAEVEAGIGDLTESQSLHVICGRWQSPQP
jgi:hypothetical protein